MPGRAATPIAVRRRSFRRRTAAAGPPPPRAAAEAAAGPAGFIGRTICRVGTVAAEVTRNPHNQTLNVVVQWGLLGAVVLYGMWLSHLLLFRGERLVGRIGLVVM